MAVLAILNGFLFGGILFLIFFLTRLLLCNLFWPGKSWQSFCSSLPSTKIIRKRYHSWLNSQTIFIIVFCFKNSRRCYFTCRVAYELISSAFERLPLFDPWKTFPLFCPDALQVKHSAVIRLVSSVSSKLSMLQTGKSVSQRFPPWSPVVFHCPCLLHVSLR